MWKRFSRQQRNLLHIVVAVLCICLSLVACKKEPAPKKVHAEKPTEKLMGLLKATPAPCKADFLTAATGLRDHHKRMDIELSIAQLP